MTQLWSIESHQLASSFSELTFELAQGAVQSLLADQTTSRIAAELWKNVNVRSSFEKSFAIRCYRNDVEKE